MDIILDLPSNDTTRVSPKSFQLLNLLGKGKYGKVFKVRKMHGNDENKIYAMKIVKKKILIQQENELTFIRNALSEKNVLRTSNHPFIIKLFYSFQTDSELHYVLEYASGGNFHGYLIRRGKFSEASASFYIKQVILAVEYLHSRSIVHRDIKPENILLDCNGFIKLADFGICKKQFINQKLYSVCGTYCYMAPEIFQKNGYGKEVDWWSTGVLFYQMLVGKFPFSGDANSMIEKIAKCEYNNPPRFVSPTARNLIEMLLQINVQQRLGSNGAHEIKEHEFFLNASWENIFYQLEAPPFVPKPRRDTGGAISAMLDFVLKLLFGLDSIQNNEFDEKHNALFNGFTFTYDTMDEFPSEYNSEHRVKIYGVDRLLSKKNERDTFSKYNLFTRGILFWNRITNLIRR